MPKNTIIMIGDGMGWEMARAAAIVKQMQAGSAGNTLSDYYTAGKGTGLSFQNLTNYALSTTYGTTIADGDGKFSTGNSATIQRVVALCLSKQGTIQSTSSGVTQIQQTPPQPSTPASKAITTPLQ